MLKVANADLKASHNCRIVLTDIHLHKFHTDCENIRGRLLLAGFVSLVEGCCTYSGWCSRVVVMEAQPRIIFKAGSVELVGLCFCMWDDA